MLQVDWKLVETKTEALYTRYRQGLKYSELEAELQAEGLDKTTINYINEALIKRQLDDKGKKLNWPLFTFSILVTFVVVLGVSILFAKANVLVVMGGGVLLFTVVRLVVGRKAQNKNIGTRWK